MQNGCGHEFPLIFFATSYIYHSNLHGPCMHIWYLRAGVESTLWMHDALRRFLNVWKIWKYISRLLTLQKDRYCFFKFRDFAIFEFSRSSSWVVVRKTFFLSFAGHVIKSERVGWLSRSAGVFLFARRWSDISRISTWCTARKESKGKRITLTYWIVIVLLL